MTEVYRIQESRVIQEAQRVEKLLLEACDPDTRTLLRLSDINIWPCGVTAQPTLNITCKIREVTEAIGLRQGYIKSILKQITNCQIAMAVHYKIPEGSVYYDTEGKVTPAKWYVCNRKECGQMKITLDI